MSWLPEGSLFPNEPTSDRLQQSVHILTLLTCVSFEYEHCPRVPHSCSPQLKLSLSLSLCGSPILQVASWHVIRKFWVVQPWKIRRWACSCLYIDGALRKVRPKPEDTLLLHARINLHAGSFRFMQLQSKSSLFKIRHHLQIWSLAIQIYCMNGYRISCCSD